MRAPLTGLLMLLVACESGGTLAQSSNDGGGDATMGDAGGDAEDASEDSGDSAQPCVSIVPGNPTPSNDCILAGSCPADCAQGTAASYACNAASVAADAGAYPSAFQAPSGIVSVVAFETAAYPWDGGAWLSCGPLTCIRWSTADHVNGGSAWPSDPCAGDGGAPLAWVCPTVAGVLPPADAGCSSAGDMNVIGGGEAGVPASSIWCCPGVPAMPADGGSPEASTGEGGSDEAGADASSD